LYANNSPLRQLQGRRTPSTLSSFNEGKASERMSRQTTRVISRFCAQ
jgi:hypothetical protein